MKRKASELRQPLWLTPEAIAAAGRLSQVTGLSLHELVETALLGVDADELSRELLAGYLREAASPAPADPLASAERPPARIIPIDRLRRPPGSDPENPDRPASAARQRRPTAR